MKILATMKCYLKAVGDFFLHGIWVPHVFRNVDYEKCTIISTDHSFRVSASLQHERGETVHQNACLITSRCIYCGKESKMWMSDWNDTMKILAEEEGRPVMEVMKEMEAAK